MLDERQEFLSGTSLSGGHPPNDVRPAPEQHKHLGVTVRRGLKTAIHSPPAGGTPEERGRGGRDPRRPQPPEPAGLLPAGGVGIRAPRQDFRGELRLVRGFVT